MHDLDIQVAVAKVGKYATSESGDTLEMIERPQGGLSLVLADGQRSGRAAKRISNIVVRKAISLLADGVRDGAVARAAHDYLRTMRAGQVSATLNIVSIDLETETLVISRNSHCPSMVSDGEQVTLLDEPSESVGIRSWTKPVITELALQADTYVLVYTDGLCACRAPVWPEPGRGAPCFRNCCQRSGDKRPPARLRRRLPTRSWTARSMPTEGGRGMTSASWWSRFWPPVQSAMTSAD